MSEILASLRDIEPYLISCGKNVVHITARDLCQVQLAYGKKQHFSNIAPFYDRSLSAVIFPYNEYLVPAQPVKLDKRKKSQRRTIALAEQLRALPSYLIISFAIVSLSFDIRRRLPTYGKRNLRLFELRIAVRALLTSASSTEKRFHIFPMSTRGFIKPPLQTFQFCSGN